MVKRKKEGKTPVGSCNKTNGKGEKICFICLSDDGDISFAANKLCDCPGPLGFLHLECLQTSITKCNNCNVEFRGSKVDKRHSIPSISWLRSFLDLLILMIPFFFGMILFRHVLFNGFYPTPSTLIRVISIFVDLSAIVCYFGIVIWLCFEVLREKWAESNIVTNVTIIE